LKIDQEIKDLNREEQIAYFHNRAETGPFRAWLTITSQIPGRVEIYR
jgi:hypothetical protein